MTRVKVEQVIGMIKKKFPCLCKKIQYQPDVVCDIVKAVGFLWNIGILTGNNKGYDPDQFVVEDEEDLKERLEASPGGRLVRNVVCNYLWDHRH